jgi:transmembrane sensor
VKEILQNFWEEFEPENPVFSEQQSKRILNTVLAAKEEQQHGIFKLNKWKAIMGAAAVLLLICSISLLFINPRSFEKLAARSVKGGKALSSPDVTAGRSTNALLILSDGRKIVLNDLSAGEVLNQSGIRIVKAEDGQLVYSVAEQAGKSNIQNSAIEYNTITTPKGSQYQVNLPDGSKVWLNAMSSLKFPTKFQGSERAVELTGEAYFEISAFYSGNVKLPFKVKSISGKDRSQEVEVLGTHFNIDAYPDVSSTRTTLLEGSVKVTNLNSKDVNILTPGQQAILDGSRSTVSTANIEDAMAWKNGNFMFNNLELADIMKELERWYDVKVDYSNIPATRYHGFISKKVSLSQVLEMLELTGNVKFKISAIPGKSEKEIHIIHE